MKFETPPPTGNLEFDKWANRLVQMLRVQPAFLVQPSAAQENFAADEWVEIAWGTEVFDIGGNFASNTFTAPISGKYEFNAAVFLSTLDIDAAEYNLQIVTTQASYYIGYVDSNLVGSADFNGKLGNSIILPMDAGDTAVIQIKQTGGAAQSDILVTSHFSGYLIK